MTIALISIRHSKSNDATMKIAYYVHATDCMELYANRIVVTSKMNHHVI